MSRLDDLIAQYCPNGVEYKNLSEIVSIVRGKRVVKDQLSSECGYPVYQNSLIPLGYHTEANNKANTTFIIVAGAAGEIGFSDQAFWAADDCFALLGNEEIDNRYIYHAVLNQKALIMTKVRKASIPRLSREAIENLRIPFPPLPVQQEIVRILDSFTQLTAELRSKLQEELESRKKQYAYYRNNLISNAIGNKGKLLDLLSQPITDGPHTTPRLVSDGIPFISATAVYNGRIHLENAQGFITKEFDAECAKKYKPQKYDIFMVKSGSTTGKVALVDTDDNFNIWSPLAAMRTSNEVTAKYVYQLLQTTAVQQQVQTRMSHGSQPNLSMRALEQFDVNIPSLAEQGRIVSLLEKMDLITNNLYVGLSTEIEALQRRYEYYRDKLLTFKEKKA